MVYIVRVDGVKAHVNRGFDSTIREIMSLSTMSVILSVISGTKQLYSYR